MFVANCSTHSRNRLHCFIAENSFQSLCFLYIIAGMDKNFNYYLDLMNFLWLISEYPEVFDLRKSVIRWMPQWLILTKQLIKR